MISPVSLSAPSSILRFPSLAERSGLADPDHSLTLSGYYHRFLLPRLTDLENEEALADRSLESDRNALRNWSRYTDDPAVSQIGPEHLEQLVSNMKQAGRRPPTINKVWRECRAMLAEALEDGFLDRVPVRQKLRRGKRHSSRLVKEAPVIHRELVTVEELTRLWRACRRATYPAGGQQPAAKLWRVALVLFWTYGPRTLDVFGLDFEQHIKWRDRLILFTAIKTGKLQGLPLTPIVEQHLRSIRGCSHRVFPGFNSAGCFLRKRSRWKPGYYTTWRNEISADSSLAAPVTFKHFRQRVVTKYDALQKDLGKWIAGHFVPGVSAQNYANPSDEIRAAICGAPVPECFREIG